MFLVSRRMISNRLGRWFGDDTFLYIYENYLIFTYIKFKTEWMQYLESFLKKSVFWTRFFSIFLVKIIRRFNYTSKQWWYFNYHMIIDRFFLFNNQCFYCFIDDSYCTVIKEVRIGFVRCLTSLLSKNYH